MAAPNFRSASVSAPQTRQVSPPPSRFGASCAPPLRQNSLDSFRAKVKPLVIARPATADEAPGERHPLEIWEINYDEIFPNSARLAKQFAEKSLKLSSPPVPSAASPAASSVVPSAACASAARTAPQQLTPRDRVSEALPSLSPDVDNSSPLSELASPQSPPRITIPARALDDFTSPPSFPQLRARMLGCKLGTPCIVSLARTPGDPGAWDADDEEYESEESTRRRFRRSGSTGGSRHWVGEKHPCSLPPPAPSHLLLPPTSCSLPPPPPSHLHPCSSLFTPYRLALSPASLQPITSCRHYQHSLPSPSSQQYPSQLPSTVRSAPPHPRHSSQPPQVTPPPDTPS
ncbi:unnamed protein product [Closterium sp. Naga37s-1]|nr:unnamed protein product [Closterium sp. Naga37s-1]